LSRYSFSWKAIGRRFAATPAAIPRYMNVVRAISSEGFGRIKYHTRIRQLLDTDREVRAYFAQETDQLPAFYLARIKRELGPMYEMLPEGSLVHDPYAYLASEAQATLTPVLPPARMAAM
jgi:hypothetical protein